MMNRLTWSIAFCVLLVGLVGADESQAETYARIHRNRTPTPPPQVTPAPYAELPEQVPVRTLPQARPQLPQGQAPYAEPIVPEQIRPQPPLVQGQSGLPQSEVPVSSPSTGTSGQGQVPLQPEPVRPGQTVPVSGQSGASVLPPRPQEGRGVTVPQQQQPQLSPELYLDQYRIQFSNPDINLDLSCRPALARLDNTLYQERYVSVFGHGPRDTVHLAIYERSDPRAEGSEPDLVWVNASNSTSIRHLQDIDPVSGAQDRTTGAPLYVCRAFGSDAIIYAGYVSPSTGLCYITPPSRAHHQSPEFQPQLQGPRPRQFAVYQVLTNPHHLLLDWVEVGPNFRSIPNGAVLFANEPTGEPLFVGRVEDHDGRVVGQVVTTRMPVNSAAAAPYSAGAETGADGYYPFEQKDNSPTGNKYQILVARPGSWKK